jgi:AraC family transcriptional regulator
VVTGADSRALQPGGSGGSRVTLLLRTRDVLLGEFRCPPDDELWVTDNDIGDLPHVVWPLTTVEIRRAGLGTVCADANTVMLYNPGTHYRRRRIVPAGDRSLFLAFSPALFTHLPSAALHADRDRFAVGHAWCTERAWLDKESLAAAARSGRTDTLQLEEMALSATYGVLGGSSMADVAARGRDRIRERVEHARMLLGQQLDSRLHVTGVANVVGVSPFHLARQFRELTGTSMYAYRQALRVRCAVQRALEDPGGDLSAVAVENGFASHSHFTATCRRTFGSTPSALRAQLNA